MIPVATAMAIVQKACAALSTTTQLSATRSRWTTLATCAQITPSNWKSFLGTGPPVTCDLNVCEWNLASLGSDSEFTDCPTQAGYVVNGCKGCPDGSFDVNVPSGYIGAYLVNPGDQDCVCNT